MYRFYQLVLDTRPPKLLPSRLLYARSQCASISHLAVPRRRHSIYFAVFILVSFLSSYEWKCSFQHVSINRPYIQGVCVLVPLTNRTRTSSIFRIWYNRALVLIFHFCVPYFVGNGSIDFPKNFPLEHS